MDLNELKKKYADVAKESVLMAVKMDDPSPANKAALGKLIEMGFNLGWEAAITVSVNLPMKDVVDSYSKNKSEAK